MRPLTSFLDDGMAFAVGVEDVASVTVVAMALVDGFGAAFDVHFAQCATEPLTIIMGGSDCARLVDGIGCCDALGANSP